VKPPRLHEAKLIKFGDQEAEIDEEIADLVLNFWKLGLRTSNSCQDNVPKGFVWIEFCSVCDAEVFLSLVAEYSEEYGSVYDRMTRAWGDRTALDWQYNTDLTDFGVDLEYPNDDEFVPRFTGKHDLRFSMSVRFPRQDLEFVKKRISTALSARR
jgi:hypothetical protein